MCIGNIASISIVYEKSQKFNSEVVVFFADIKRLDLVQTGTGIDYI